MYAKVLILITTVFFLNCTNHSSKSIDDDLVDAVLEALDSNAFHEKIISVIKSDYDYKDYDLYKISGYRDYMRPDDYPYQIMELRDKIVFFFSFDTEKNLPHEDIDKIIEENYNCRNWGDPCSNIAYFFVKCKDSDKKLLYKAINNTIRSFEIPEIRDFSCSSNSSTKKDIEIITEDFVLHALDDYVLEKDTIKKFPSKMVLTLNIYNRTDTCISLDATNSLLGQFNLINGNDSLTFKVKELYINNFVVDDPTYKQDPQRYARLMLISDENLSFFSKINSINYHDNLISLIRDSLFYLPNKELYSSYGDKCIFPKDNIKVITPPEGYYVYLTPKYEYIYSSGKLFMKDER